MMFVVDIDDTLVREIVRRLLGVIIATKQFEETKELFGGIAYPAHKYGRVIYEAA